MLSGRFDGLDAFGKFLEQHPHFKPREPHAKADMRAALAKGDMAVWGAEQVDAEGVIEGALEGINEGTLVGSVEGWQVGGTNDGILDGFRLGVIVGDTVTIMRSKLSNSV